MGTVVEGDPKAPFSIATTLRLWEGCYSIPKIIPLYPWSIPYNAECLTRKVQVTIIWVLGMTRPGIELRSPVPLANTLTIVQMGRFVYFENSNTMTQFNSLENWKRHAILFEIQGGASIRRFQIVCTSIFMFVVFGNINIEGDFMP